MLIHHHCSFLWHGILFSPAFESEPEKKNRVLSRTSAYSEEIESAVPFICRTGIVLWTH